MTLPASGQLSINDINALFQRGTKLSDYRGTHWYKDDCSSGYFNSTNLRITDFYGTRPDAPTFSVNVSGYDVNLYWYCVARGWNQCSIVYATVTNNVVGSGIDNWAMIIDGFTNGVVLINNNYIVGHGGKGGHGGDYTGSGVGEDGQHGGHALYVGTNNTGGVTIYNNGVIGGGGGGGGGGTLYEHGYSCDGQYTTDYLAGGGGGGGAAYGTGGRGGSTAGTYTGYIGVLFDGDSGDNADLTNPGGGGAPGGGPYGTGGNGGGIGQSGVGKTEGYGISYGGSPGWAVYGTNQVNWGAYGTVLGPVGNS